jgi:hypothetical protein
METLTIGLLPRIHYAVELANLWALKIKQVEFVIVRHFNLLSMVEPRPKTWAYYSTGMTDELPPRLLAALKKLDEEFGGCQLSLFSIRVAVAVRDTRSVFVLHLKNFFAKKVRGSRPERADALGHIDPGDHSPKTTSTR